MSKPGKLKFMRVETGLGGMVRYEQQGVGKQGLTIHAGQTGIALSGICNIDSHEDLNAFAKAIALAWQESERIKRQHQDDPLPTSGAI